MGSFFPKLRTGGHDGKANSSDGFKSPREPVRRSREVSAVSDQYERYAGLCPDPFHLFPGSGRDPSLPPQTVQRFPWLRDVFADCDHVADKLPQAPRSIGKWTLENIRRSGAVNDFPELPQRWVIKGTWAWLFRIRRLAKDFEQKAKRASSAPATGRARRILASPILHWIS